MGTFIVAFIGNGFVASAQDAPLLSKLTPKARRRLLVLLYFTVRSTHFLVKAPLYCLAHLCLCEHQPIATAAKPPRKPFSHASLVNCIARLAAKRCQFACFQHACKPLWAKS